MVSAASVWLLASVCLLQPCSLTQVGQFCVFHALIITGSPDVAPERSGGDGQHRGGPAPPQRPAGGEEDVGSGSQQPQAADGGWRSTGCKNQGELLDFTEEEPKTSQRQARRLTSVAPLCDPCSVALSSYLSLRATRRWRRPSTNRWRTWRRKWASGESHQAAELLPQRKRAKRRMVFMVTPRVLDVTQDAKFFSVQPCWGASGIRLMFDKCLFPGTSQETFSALPDFISLFSLETFFGPR